MQMSLDLDLARKTVFLACNTFRHAAFNFFTAFSLTPEDILLASLWCKPQLSFSALRELNVMLNFKNLTVNKRQLHWNVIWNYTLNMRRINKITVIASNINQVTYWAFDPDWCSVSQKLKPRVFFWVSEEFCSTLTFFQSFYDNWRTMTSVDLLPAIRLSFPKTQFTWLVLQIRSVLFNFFAPCPSLQRSSRRKLQTIGFRWNKKTLTHVWL